MRSCCGGIRLWALILLALMSGIVPAAGGTPDNADPSKTPDILTAYGFRAWEGAIPGYIDDGACSAGGCHAGLCREFAGADKARSFSKPRKDRFLADFTQTFYHDLSDRYYEMIRSGDSLLFRQWQKDSDGAPINVLEVPVDWLHGSGTLARAYIVQVPSGEMYQLPIVWLNTPRRWGMAPGYDIKDHLGLQRRVQRECQFCHNGYTELPENGDAFSAPLVFPEQLTQGIGCQRCHGPGAEHTRLGLLALDPANTVDEAALRDSIVNQARLSPELNDQVCNQCHARTAKLVPALTRFGRGIFSYRPGEPLDDFMVSVNVSRAGTKMEGRIGAISQPTRTYQSRCYKESDGKLTCITCHDSHRRIPEEERAGFYRDACFKCHTPSDCTVQKDALSDPASPDCVACHMPKRPSTVDDFPITDHLLEARPVMDIPPTPLRGRKTLITDAWVAEKGDMGELYRLCALVRAGAGADAVALLETVISRLQPEASEPYLLLAKGCIRLKQWERASRAIARVLEKDPGNGQALDWKAICLFSTGRKEDARALLRKVLDTDGNRTETLFNLGLFSLLMNQDRDAETELGKAVALNPFMFKGWYYLGVAHEKLGQDARAIDNYRKALAIEPSFGRAYVQLGKALVRNGNQEEARRYFLHGIKAADDPEPVKSAYTLAFARGTSITGNTP